MSTYRLRGATVEAEQFTRMPEGDEQPDIAGTCACKINARPHLHHKDGVQAFDVGDYVITHPDGRLESMKEKDFEKKYEPAPVFGTPALFDGEPVHEASFGRLADSDPPEPDVA